MEVGKSPSYVCGKGKSQSPWKMFALIMYVGAEVSCVVLRVLSGWVDEIGVGCLTAFDKL